MIEMLEGVPGSGKSYHAVAHKFLPWVRQGRRIYIYVDGIHLDRLALFEGLPLPQLEQQITVWWTKNDVLTNLLTVEPGSAVLLDEVQTLFRSKEKHDPEILRWLETHRHRGIDVVMMCQHANQCTLGVIRLVEATTKFRRLDRFGLKGRYQAQVRGNPEETEVIRMFTGRYESKIYAYYSSYAHAAITESARGGSILKSPTLIVGLIGLAVAITWFSSGGWLTGATQQKTVALPPPPTLTASSTPSGHSTSQSHVPPTIHPIRIQGGMQMRAQDPTSWLWVSEEGKLLTEAEIAAHSGGVVRSVLVRGVRQLEGSGVIWGGTPREMPRETQSLLPEPSVPSIPSEAPKANHEPPTEEYKGNGVDILKTPPSLL
jgi:zona occludens toxin (predicted ATPase)